MRTVFEYDREHTSKNDYIKAVAAMQLDRQDCTDDEFVAVHTKDDYKQYEIVDPWYDPLSGKDLSDREADDTYGAYEVAAFKEEVLDLPWRLLKDVILDNGWHAYITKDKYGYPEPGYSVVFDNWAEIFDTMDEAEKELGKLDKEPAPEGED